jgi:hypothetical protein
VTVEEESKNEQHGNKVNEPVQINTRMSKKRKLLPCWPKNNSLAGVASFWP